MSHTLTELDEQQRGGSVENTRRTIIDGNFHTNRPKVSHQPVGGLSLKMWIYCDSKQWRNLRNTHELGRGLKWQQICNRLTGTLVKYVLFFIISFLSQVFLGSQDLSKHVLNEMLHNASLSTILNTMFDLGTTMVLQWVQCTFFFNRQLYPL